MIQLTALYGHPQDPAAIDRYYRETHAPLAKTLPGLKGYTANNPTSLNPQEQSPYYLIANLYFDDMGALQAALQSHAGQATAGDLQNFATGGVTLVTGEVVVYDPVLIG
jgi:uncharacterized protein (TIGR02118 family)